MSEIIFRKKIRGGEFITYNEKPDFEIFKVNQVHGTKIVKIPFCENPDADGIYCDKINFKTPITIVTADCLPIAISGTGFCIIHAGWRGLASKVLLKPEIASINPEYFFIGPHIRKCCYQVSIEFKEHFHNKNAFTEKNHQLFLDLETIAKEQILGQYPNAVINSAHECTCCNTKFNSYRRNKTLERNWNLFVPDSF